MGLLTFTMALPFEMVNSFIVQPLLLRTLQTYDDYRNRTKEGALTVREIIVKLFILALAAAVVIWMAVFMYIAFYYTYMPAIAHIRPVHMQFKTCQGEKGPCTFPQAHVLLTKKQQLLMIGQQYRISVQIDMPESEENLRLGMFMVCAEMRDQHTNLQNHACRSAMLHYRSHLARTITTIVMSPFIVLGWKEETQQIPVEIFNAYEDDQENPVTDVFVEIQSQNIQFYSVTLHITAHFSGLRYIMFHWPILSATIGVGANLFFILTISLLSWYHWSDSVWVEEGRQRIRNRTKGNRRERHENRISNIAPTSVAAMGEDNKSLLDDEDISVIEEDIHHHAFYNENDGSDVEELGDFVSSSTVRQRRTD